VDLLLLLWLSLLSMLHLFRLSLSLNVLLLFWLGLLGMLLWLLFGLCLLGMLHLFGLSLSLSVLLLLFGLGLLFWCGGVLLLFRFLFWFLSRVQCT